jgi:hypothetical protein
MNHPLYQGPTRGIVDLGNGLWREKTPEECFVARMKETDRAEGRREREYDPEAILAFFIAISQPKR